jgi:hypothetical protein
MEKDEFSDVVGNFRSLHEYAHRGRIEIKKFKAETWVNHVKIWWKYLPATCPFCDGDLALVHRDNPFDVLYCKQHGFLKVYSMDGLLEIHPTLESALGPQGYAYHLKQFKKR